MWFEYKPKVGVSNVAEYTESQFRESHIPYSTNVKFSPETMKPPNSTKYRCTIM
jgi:hypothetical protein